ncbi:MAG: ammonium transporter [Actinomyces sp.]|uniref:Ammonium transporter n=1 Tax=Schaalia naturae TaxID=635203 RepID=A0ABW2SKH2_9ACTO|nr:ammonium transporter [Actinomyces sp.]MCI1641944.1 ammonium transporter [Actinomyces sp.]MCI1661957.1 ammonium transporter [Actinomyces sp.]MCI1691164.1 ammonium transporter [Actinomyces sp.]MCI1787760.1 ammonium transporter [Actinomyces sp.]MCI1830333.1 ammonium transporter [Actinomyces sp.]
MDTLDTGATAWMLTSASLVLLMTPGLALFYGGMSRTKSVLNMMMMSFGVIAVVAVVYPLWGYSMSYGPTDIGGIFANPFEWFGLRGSFDGAAVDGYGVPGWVGVAFQMTFAIITVALISGSLAERVRFSTWLVFVLLWVTFSYFPMAHMVWGGGFLSADGPIASLTGVAPIDFAGGTVVHINAGIAGLVLALIIGKRPGFGKEPMRPHNLPFVMMGAALLFFGWFGFNAGSAFTADDLAGLAWVNTTVATGAAVLGWMLVERLRDGHATSLGAASGVVAGLVAVTPAAGSIDPIGAVVLGLIAGALCAAAVSLKFRFGYDDSLDVVGVHLVGGLTGTVLIGFLSTETGLFYGGGAGQLLTQILIALCALVFSGVITAVLGLALRATMGWRISPEDEVRGIDLAEHSETAYDNPTASARLA